MSLLCRERTASGVGWKPSTCVRDASAALAVSKWPQGSRTMSSGFGKGLYELPDTLVGHRLR